MNKLFERFKVKPSLKFNETDYQKIFTKRLRVFSIIFTSVFLVILVQLFRIQVVNFEVYQTKLDLFTQRIQNIASPRGEIYDRNGEILVGNQERLAIVYFPPNWMTSSKEWDLAYKIADDFEFSYDHLTIRDLKDLFILLYPEVSSSKITEEEWAQYKQKKLTDTNIYELKLARISDLDLARLDYRTQEAFVVKTAMSKSPYNSLKIIKDNVTVDEVALLIENNIEYPGFDVSIFFDRSYPQGTLLKGLFGSVTSSAQGLVSENLLSYLALGYSRNSSVGKSGLELQYESLLKGSDSQYLINYNEEGYALLSEYDLGSKGQDLKLSIDLDLQRKVEDVLKNTLIEHQDNPLRAYMDTIYLVAMNPKTGDIYALAGMKENEAGEIYNDPVSTYTDSFAAGSSIKGAVVYLGLDQGVIQAGETILDEPIKIADTPLKRSYQDLGYVNDLTALSKSSNVYMFHIAMRLGGAKYIYNQRLSIDPQAFDTFRYYFSQFGLGVYTGIDMPNESLGYRGYSSLGGHLLDFAIGQYDTYTTIQLAQYISTIANDGIRVEPRVVLESNLSATSITAYQNSVKILSSLENSVALNRVQDGFRLCVTDGLCRNLSSLPVSVAAKTGTAENYIYTLNDSFDAPNSVLVSYAPFENPEISIACAIPHAWNTTSQTNLCLSISNQIYAEYFNK